MKPYDLCIVTTTYFEKYGGCQHDEQYRWFLFQDLLSSMHSVDWNGKRVIWLIYDDGSPAFPEFGQLSIPVEIHRCEHEGWVRSLNKGCTRACELADWVLNLDSDGLVAEDAIARIFGLVDRYPEATAYGLFNTRYHFTKSEHTDHVIKQSLPEHGILFRAADYDLVPRPDNFPLLARLPVEPVGYPVLKPSGIQHCGKFGVNSTEDDFDPEFQLCMATTT